MADRHIGAENVNDLPLASLSNLNNDNYPLKRSTTAKYVWGEMVKISAEIDWKG